MLPKTRKQKRRPRQPVDPAKGLSLKTGRLPLPPRVTIWTRFQKDIDMSNAGVAFANVRFQPTYCYDVDPLGASTAMPFFTEMAGLYRFYRCVSSRITVHFANADSAPATVYVCPVNFDPGANTSSFQNYLSNPNCREAIIGATSGNSKATLRARATTDGFSGSRWLGLSDSYSATSAGTTTPNNNWFWIVGAHNINLFTNGVFASIVMDVEITFFEETSPST